MYEIFWGKTMSHVLIYHRKKHRIISTRKRFHWLEAISVSPNYVAFLHASNNLNKFWKKIACDYIIHNVILRAVPNLKTKDHGLNQHIYHIFFLLFSVINFNFCNSSKFWFIFMLKDFVINVVTWRLIWVYQWK